MALFVLYFVLPLPFAFLVLAVEEACTFHRWMRANLSDVTSHHPRFQPLLCYLSGLSTRGLCLALLERWLMLLVVTAIVLTGAPQAWVVWPAVFLAFSLGLLLRFVWAVCLRRYVPGLFTSLLLAFYAILGARSVLAALSTASVLLCVLVGFTAVCANYLFSLWIGRKLSCANDQ